MQSTYHAVKFAPLVALGLSFGVLALPRAELSEILSGPWGHMGEKLHFHSAQRLT